MVRHDDPRKKNQTGIPGLDSSVDKTFDSFDQMAKSLNAFVTLLYKYYSSKDKELAKDIPNLFGFILRTIDVVEDPNIKTSRVSIPPGQGRLIIYASRNPGETDEAWEHRSHEIKAIYVPKLPLAQIQAQVQLYLLLKDKARSNLPEVGHLVNPSDLELESPSRASDAKNTDKSERKNK